MKILNISGKEVLLDIEDYGKFKNEEIFLMVNSKYPMIKKDNQLYYLHRLIMKTKKNELVDHINMNTLDNRKSNLRIVNRTNNRANQKKSKIKNPTSKFKGVFFDKTHKRWNCKVTKENKMFFHGKFKDEISAAFAYNYYASLAFGEHARLNDLEKHKELEKEWKNKQIKRKNNSKQKIYKYINWDEKQNVWKASIQSKKYGDSPKKSFKKQHEALLYCNEEIIKRRLYELEKSKTIQELKDRDLTLLNKEEKEKYKNQLEIKIRMVNK